MPREPSFKTHWKTKDGTWVKIRDMENGHLVNTIKLLKRGASEERLKALRAGYSVLSMLHGEEAVASVERDLDLLEDGEFDEEFLHESYPALVKEADRRELEY